MTSNAESATAALDVDCSLSAEDDLKKILQNEAEHRLEFSRQLQNVISRLAKQQLIEQTGGDKASVTELLKRVETADHQASKHLRQCRQKIDDEVSYREKAASPSAGRGSTGARTDSGYVPSPYTSANLSDPQYGIAETAGSSTMTMNYCAGLSGSYSCRASCSQPTEHTESESSSSPRPASSSSSLSSSCSAIEEGDATADDVEINIRL